MTYTNEPNYEQTVDFLRISVVGHNGEIVDTAQVPVKPVQEERAVQISGVALQHLLNEHGASAGFRISYPHIDSEKQSEALVQPTAIAEERVFYDGFMKIKPANAVVTLGGRLVDLTLKEFKLLAWLSNSPGLYLPNADIYKHVWMNGVNIEPTPSMMQTIAVHVIRIRQKADPLLAANGIGSSLIQTLRGFGYGFFPDSM